MAINTKFQTKSDVSVFIGTEVTMGTATLAGGTWHEMPVVDYSIADISSPLTVAPFRSNSFAQQESMAKHDRTQQMYEISLTMQGTAAAIDRICGALFEDSSQPNILLGSSPVTTTFDDGETNAIPVTILLDNGGTNDNDIYYTSCMCTSMELSYSIGGDGGALQLVANFVTGYNPTTGTLTPSSSTSTLGTVFNIYDLSAPTLGGNELLIMGFSLNISRAVNRVSYDSDNQFKPLGYSIGGYEVTGSINCKRDANSASVATNSSAGIALSVGDGTFAVTANDTMVEDLSVDLADEGWKHDFSYRCFYDDSAETNAVVTIDTA